MTIKIKVGILIGIFLMSNINQISGQLPQDAIKTKYLDVCYREDAKRSDITGVISIKQRIENIDILAYFDTNFDVIQKCSSGKLGNYKKNSVQINNIDLPIGNELCGIDISLFIPQRIVFVSNKNRLVILELYNLSYTSVGGGYVYIIMELDSAGKLIHHHNYEYTKKQPISNTDLLQYIANAD